MKIKTDTKLLNLKGEEIKDEDKKAITVGQIVSNTLSYAQGQANPHRCFVFAKKFATEKEVDLKAEDVVFIRKVLEDAKGLSALVSGQIIEMLEGNA